ncbi:hypothetical protein AB0F72_13875 [Actinoplanes sp. NPDC023936]|uniref:hypothetical protein n=1 Tax=Actinoplanes sp. NPDC023936 TaxID=3154910 RepID=UPI0034073F9D
MGLGTTTLAVAVALGSAAAPGRPSVTFDPATGTGFVAAADLQRASRWSGATVRKRAPGITFAISTTRTYTATCEWLANGGTRRRDIRRVVVRRTGTVAAVRVYQPRVKDQLVGFSLAGLGPATTVGTVPRVGAACTGPRRHGRWTIVKQTAAVSTLSARFGKASVKLA